MKAVLAAVLAAQAPAPAGGPPPTCEQMRRAENAPASCRAPLVLEAMHPWSGLRSLEESEAWLAEQCAPARRLREQARGEFLDRHRAALARHARWFDPAIASDGDWSALFYGRRPTICEKIQNAQG